jgi:hypothetical protein
VIFFVITTVTEKVTEMKCGRRPLGRKAMTAAERQARRRKRLREAAKAEAARLEDERLRGGRRLYQPPHGYGKAKGQLQAEGHCFVRVPDDLGREFGGVFVDGASVSSNEVIALAALPPSERKQRLAEQRCAPRILFAARSRTTCAICG